MYIEPNSEVRLLSGVPLSTTQENTLWFESLADQTAYFISKTRQIFEKVSYQRVNRGFFRCEASIIGIYDVNYMMFKNSSYEDKWFYAFVTSVDWLNNSTAQINFEIDPLQTYFFNVTLKQCFVEREHHATDNESDWKIPENIPTGYVMYDQPKASTLFDDWRVLVVTPYGWGGTQTDSIRNYGGVYSPCFLYGFDLNNFLLFMQDINTAGYGDQILSIAMCPSGVLQSMGVEAEDNGLIKDIAKGAHAGFTIFKPDKKIGNYIPKNGKLMSYPYSFLVLSDGNGKSIDLRWEYFSGATCGFNIYADLISNIYTCTPINYDGTSDSETSEYGATNVNFNYGLSSSACPQIAWLSDTYKIYLAQNKVSMLDNFISDFATIGTGLASGQPAIALNGINGIKSNLINLEQMKKAPDNMHGGGGDNSLFSGNLLDFFTTHAHISPEQAKIIDDYFSLYGYATNEVKKPNIHVRKNWTYTKTIGCVIVGNAPNDDIVAIQNIFNNGVRFWVNPANVGNYSVDNSVL